MSTRVCTEEQFLKDVATHEMTVKLDSETYRHLVFRAKGENSWCMWFEIITWPGALTIGGDMGTWSFSRLADMFEFFRCRPDSVRNGLHINESYWGEKITAESRFAGPHLKFNEEIYRANVIDSLNDYDLTDKRKAELVEELEEDVFGDDCESEVRQAVAEFKSADGEFEFSDSWEIDGQAYTYNYIWCCYAIAWAVQQYDAMKARAEYVEVVAETK